MRKKKTPASPLPAASPPSYTSELAQIEADVRAIRWKRMSSATLMALHLAARQLEEQFAGWSLDAVLQREGNARAVLSLILLADRARAELRRRQQREHAFGFAATHVVMQLGRGGERESKEALTRTIRLVAGTLWHRYSGRARQIQRREATGASRKRVLDMAVQEQIVETTHKELDRRAPLDVVIAALDGRLRHLSRKAADRLVDRERTIDRGVQPHETSLEEEHTKIMDANQDDFDWREELLARLKNARHPALRAAHKALRSAHPPQTWGELASRVQFTEQYLRRLAAREQSAAR